MQLSCIVDKSYDKECVYSFSIKNPFESLHVYTYALYILNGFKTTYLTSCTTLLTFEISKSRYIKDKNTKSLTLYKFEGRKMWTRANLNETIKEANESKEAK